MTSNSLEPFIYQISTNPINECNTIFLPLGKAEEFGFQFNNICVVTTGMNNSLEKTIAAIENSSLIYISGEMDHTSFFELGIAISLKKKVYYVSQKKESNFDLQLPYETDLIFPIELERFIEIVENIFD